MNVESFSVWADKRNVSPQRARRIFATAATTAQKYPRTDPRYWETLAANVMAAMGAMPDSKVAQEVRRLHTLANHLQNQPGELSFIDEGRELVLRYVRDSSTGLNYPFSDYCDLVIRYDEVTNQYRSKGIVFGANVQESSSDPGVFFMLSLEQNARINAIVRDFFNKALKICELYGGHNMDMFTFKLQNQIRNLGIIERLDQSKLPNIAQFTAAEVPFSAWFALSNLCLGMIKFNPALTVTGYTISVRTFSDLIRALDNYVQSHQGFVDSCIKASALNPV